MTWTGKTAKRIAELHCYLFGHRWEVDNWRFTETCKRCQNFRKNQISYPS